MTEKIHYNVMADQCFLLQKLQSSIWKIEVLIRVQNCIYYFSKIIEVQGLICHAPLIRRSCYPIIIIFKREKMISSSDKLKRFQSDEDSASSIKNAEKYFIIPNRKVQKITKEKRIQILNIFAERDQEMINIKKYQLNALNCIK